MGGQLQNVRAHGTLHGGGDVFHADAQRARLAGDEKDEVKVELKDGYLTVSAAKGLDKDEQDKKGRYIRQERYAGTMSRSFYVGEGVKPEDLHAKYEDGILQVTVPKEAPKAVPASTYIAIE